MLTRSAQNPLLSPEPAHDWENFAVFNGCVCQTNNSEYMVYRAMGNEKTIRGNTLRPSTIGIAILDKQNDCYGNRRQLIVPQFPWEQFGCEDPRITFINGTYYIFYTALGSWPPRPETIRCAVAITNNLDEIQEKHLVTPFNSKAMCLFPDKVSGEYAVLLSVHTDKPPAHIALARCPRLTDLWNLEFWQNWYAHLPRHIVPLRRVNSDQVEVGAPPVKTEYGWLLIHSYIKNYFSEKRIFRIEAALLDKNDPRRITGRVEEPLLKPEGSLEQKGQVRDVVFPSSAHINNEVLDVYYGAADNLCCKASMPINQLWKKMRVNEPAPIRATKFPHNPILKPKGDSAWEDVSVFNPAAIRLDGKTYILYRAHSATNVSSVGLAVSWDGTYIDERLADPIYTPSTPFELPRSPGTGSGCEDPRVTLMEGKIYMCYTAYDGVLPRLAMTSIPVDDFLNRRWKQWSAPVIISPPDVADKDGCLFPEKIMGKYVFFHRIEPDINISYVDSLDFPNGTYLGKDGTISPRSGIWDGLKIGINTVPIKTEAGWLVFYHGVSQSDRHYRLGALLLDLSDPTKVISRSKYPILEPEEEFERIGLVNNVVFPCGHVEVRDTIYLYYGGADSVTCGATINKKELVAHLLAENGKRYVLPC